MKLGTLGLSAAAVIWLLCPGCGDDVTEPGAEIRELYNEMAQAGETKVFWDQKTDAGNAVSPGTYGVSMSTTRFDSTAFFLIIKDESSSSLRPSAPHSRFGFGVWTGSGGYVVGEDVDVYFSIPEPTEVRLAVFRQ